jgi:hypothetical protein
VPLRRDLTTSPRAGASPADRIALFGSQGAAGASEQVPAGRCGEGYPRVWSTAPILSPEERALARLERQRLEIVTNEVIEEASDMWLMARLGETTCLDDNEMALLAYVTREASQVPPALGAFAARAMIAA